MIKQFAGLAIGLALGYYSTSTLFSEKLADAAPSGGFDLKKQISTRPKVEKVFPAGATHTEITRRIGEASPQELMSAWKKHVLQILETGNWQEALKLAAECPYKGFDEQGSTTLDLVLRAAIHQNPTAAMAEIERLHSQLGINIWSSAVAAFILEHPESAAKYLGNYEPSSGREAQAYFWSVLEFLKNSPSLVSNDLLSKAASTAPEAFSAISELASSIGAVDPSRGLSWAASTTNNRVRDLILRSVFSGASGVNSPDFLTLIADQPPGIVNTEAVKLWSEKLYDAKGVEAAEFLDRIQDTHLQQAAKDGFLRSAKAKLTPLEFKELEQSPRFSTKR